MPLITIYSEELPSGWEWTPDNYLGGTPEFVVETAEVLARNNAVIVYYDGPVFEQNDVTYLPRDQYHKPEILIACNSRPPSLGDINLYWTSKSNQRQEQYLDFDHRIVLSKCHQEIFGHNSKVIGLGCWPEQLKDGLKQDKLCIYTSSPDRGLKYLQEIWPEVTEKTGAVLKSSYGGSGKVFSPVEMNELYKTAKFWLHPMKNNAIELFCISGLKAQAAGCIPVVIPRMALAETVKYGVFAVDGDYKQKLIKAIQQPPKVPKIHIPTWEEVTNQIKDLIYS